MEAPTNKILLVKHVTGRLLLDTSKHGCPFLLEEADGSWLITLQKVNPQIAGEIHRLLTELNLFYFEDYGSEADRRKWWLYDNTCPGYVYEQGTAELQLKVNCRMGYSNEHAGKI